MGAYRSEVFRSDHIRRIELFSGRCPNSSTGYIQTRALCCSNRLDSPNLTRCMRCSKRSNWPKRRTLVKVGENVVTPNRIVSIQAIETMPLAVSECSISRNNNGVFGRIWVSIKLVKTVRLNEFDGIGEGNRNGPTGRFVTAR